MIVSNTPWQHPCHTGSTATHLYLTEVRSEKPELNELLKCTLKMYYTFNHNVSTQQCGTEKECNLKSKTFPHKVQIQRPIITRLDNNT